MAGDRPPRSVCKRPSPFACVPGSDPCGIVIQTSSSTGKEQHPLAKLFLRLKPIQSLVRGHFWVAYSSLPESSSHASTSMPTTGKKKLPLVKLIDNFDAAYSYIANDGPIFYFKTNLDAPRYRCACPIWRYSYWAVQSVEFGQALVWAVAHPSSPV